MQTKCVLISLLGSLSLSYFSVASALTITNVYWETTDIQITPAEEGESCGHWGIEGEGGVYHRHYDDIYDFRLYAKSTEVNGLKATSNVTINKDEQPNRIIEKIGDGLCVYVKHAREATWSDPKAKVVFGSATNKCELFVNANNAIKLGPGCTALK